MSLLDPPLPARARTAAVQGVTDRPTSGIVARRQQATSDRGTVEALFRDQERAALLGNKPPASYPTGKMQATVAQVVPVLEQQNQDTGQWAKVEDASLTEIVDEFQWRSLQLDLKDIAGLMAYHRMVTGEHVVVMVSSGDSIDYRIYSVQACAFNKPTRGQVTVKEAANGSVKNGTAYVVPQEAVHRCWSAHPHYPAQAWSPILAGIGPLELCASINRHMKRQVDARAVAAGGKAMIYDSSAAEGDEVDDNGNPVDEYARAIGEFGTISQDETDLRGLLPLLLHQDLKTDTKPFMLDLVNALDPKLIDWWNAALSQFAQAMNLSGLTIAAGGVGEMNHWSEWKASEENWKDAFAPFCDAVYGDITRLFLRGIPGKVGGYRDRLPVDIEQFRISYDASAVITPPDKVQSSRNLEDDGVLRGRAAALAAGFDDDDLLLEPDWTRQQERDWYLARKSAGKVQQAGEIPTAETIRVNEGGGPTTGGPGGQTPTPPTEPTGGTAPPPGGPGGPRPLPTQQVTQRAAAPKPNAQRAVDRLQRLKRDTGRRLQEQAKAAVAAAIRAATERVSLQASNAKPGTRVAALAREHDGRRALRDAYRKDGVPPAMLAALGLTEEELLADEMGAYVEGAGADLQTYMDRRQAVLEEYGFDPEMGGNQDKAAAAALFLGAGATAIARGVLTDGVAPPSPGEWSGNVPFSLIADALGIAGGTQTGTLSGNPDDEPTVSPTGELDAAAAIADQLAMETVYTWVHGAFGEPDRPYDPHVEMDGEEMRDPTDFSDDGTAISDVSSPDGWTDGDTLFPGDHDGCTCDWDVELVEPGGGSLSPSE